jgi:hypothetical protein
MKSKPVWTHYSDGGRDGQTYHGTIGRLCLRLCRVGIRTKRWPDKQHGWRWSPTWALWLWCGNHRLEYATISGRTLEQAQTAAETWLREWVKL